MNTFFSLIRHFKCVCVCKMLSLLYHEDCDVGSNTCLQAARSTATVPVWMHMFIYASDALFFYFIFSLMIFIFWLNPSLLLSLKFHFVLGFDWHCFNKNAEPFQKKQNTHIIQQLYIFIWAFFFLVPSLQHIFRSVHIWIW